MSHEELLFKSLQAIPACQYWGGDCPLQMIGSFSWLCLLGASALEPGKLFSDQASLQTMISTRI